LKVAFSFFLHFLFSRVVMGLRRLGRVDVVALASNTSSPVHFFTDWEGLHYESHYFTGRGNGRNICAERSRVTSMLIGPSPHFFENAENDVSTVPRFCMMGQTGTAYSSRELYGTAVPVVGSFSLRIPG
jgi:hypothetical protein